MFLHPSSPHRFRRVPLHRRHRPRGVAVVIVLGLLAVTLAVSYATLRGQGTSTQLARNNSRALDARVAAQSGLAAALRKISENAWGGVDSTLDSNVTNNSSYHVTFTTGDATLGPAHQFYNELPFRLMVDSTGTALDPLNPAVKSEHKSRCVVQLARTKILAEPAIWPSLTSKTVFQYSDDDAHVQFPVRINGPTTLHGRLFLCTQYPNNASALNQYLTDLNTRHVAGLGDDRPFPSTMTLRGIGTVQDATTVTNLTARLGMVLTNTAASTSPPLSHPNSVTKYRLYPGGKEYEVKPLHDVANPFQNVTIAPHPETNPLGIYSCNDPLEIKSNVQFTGTIITDGSGGSDITISGTNVVLNAYNLPALYGTNTTYQLPAVMAVDEFSVNATADAKINGMAIIWDEFEIKGGATNTKFELKGNLITSSLLLRGRTPTWTQTPVLWNSDRLQFNAQVALPTGIPYFPDYQQSTKGFTVKPALTFSPDSSGVTPHWHDWSQPIYQPDPADPGLRWEVIRWEDNL